MSEKSVNPKKRSRISSDRVTIVSDTKVVILTALNITITRSIFSYSLLALENSALDG